jgi:DNA-binding PadR family transcriptional regulator
MSSDLSRLTATDVAILGMVAMRPCTTYELSKAMERSFDYFWPRARSLIYAEVKQLASIGLVEATQDFVGRRRRTTYAITPAGRQALADWLATPPSRFALEFEGLLRVYLAPFGDRESLLRTLAQTGRDAEAMLTIARDFKLEYLAGQSPFMEQVHVRALLDDFLGHFAELVYRWTERSRAVVESWPDLDPEGKQAAALDTIAAMPTIDDIGDPDGGLRMREASPPRPA